MKILIVDDIKQNLAVLEAILVGNHYDVESALNGAEALEKLRTDGFDMIISDVLMPVMDGYKLCQECKSDEALKHIPFVFYSATYTDAKDEKLASSMGASGFIIKPAEPAEFIKIIQGLIQDVEKGKVSQKQPVAAEEIEVLKLYSERLIAKLEKKMLALEAETAQRRQAEEKIKHLNLVLRAIRNVNQLIIKEKNSGRLLKEACNNLTKTRGYYNAWIALLDESGRLLRHAEAGLGKDFLPMVEQLKRGELPTCCQQALRQAGVVVILDPYSTCSDCSLAKKLQGKGVMVIRLKSNEKVYGLLVASVPAKFAGDEEEQSLFREVAGDIAFALYSIELEEERNRAEHSLGERVKELQCLYGISKIAGIPGITLDELYQKGVYLIPQGWQYPEIACARITLNDREYKTNNYGETAWKQSADIKIGGAKAGSVEVVYLEKRPEIDEGPFLKEERLLIDAVAERLGNITEGKKAEQSLQAAEAELKHTIEVVPGIIATANAQTGYFTHCNPALSNILGFSTEEFLARPFMEFIHPDDRQSTINEVEKQLKGSPVARFENRYICKDGSYKWLEWRATAADENGVVYCAATDITERRRAEEDLRESEERYRSVFSEARDGITIVDMETGSITDCNPEFEKQTGRTLKQLKKMKIWEIITPEKASAAKKKFLEIQRSGSGGSADLEIQKPNGELVFIEFRSKRLGIQGGKYTQSISRDITERKRAEEERIALEQKAQVASHLASVGEMAAGIAHEINNPLTGVIGFTHLLLQRDIPEDMRDDVEIISESAKRVSDIVKRMLTFARPQKGRRECIDIKQLIETTLALRAYALETNNIEVTTVFDPDLPPTLVDGGQLQQVFLNIIINAETEMKLAHGKGKLLVKAEKVGDTIRISFKDDGPGITKENMTKLFNPFFTTREVGQGTGLGLSVCHGIIKEHNGQIYAESKPGKGATFIVELPIVVEEKQLGLAELAAAEAEAPKGKILVVDDEPTVREFLTKLLVGKGHEVESVGSASDALTMIKSERYGVILLDVKMPGMSGNELYKRVQKIAKSLAKRIVFVTGDTMGIDTRNFLAKTGAHYISKPIDVKDLMKAINKILS